MSEQPSKCRLCDGSRLESLGHIPSGDYFAGRVLPGPIRGGRLWSCVDCDSLFRHPILSASQYRELYERGAAGQWSGDIGRLDLEAVRAVVRSHPGAVRILDIGCGTGDFLASLPGTLQKFGIEPAVDAGSAAGQHGIRISAPTLEELSADARFDVITVIDVIEHIPDPFAFLRQAFAHLSKDGLLVVSTGNPEVSVWRKVFRSRFWYSSFPEHISFPSRKLYDRVAADGRGAVESVTPTSYRVLPLWKAAVFGAIQIAYQLSPRLFDWVGRFLGVVARAPAPRRQRFSPGVGGLFVDHWVVAIRRTS